LVLRHKLPESAQHAHFHQTRRVRRNAMLRSGFARRLTIDNDAPEQSPIAL
jgi:hypothetical protein